MLRYWPIALFCFGCFADEPLVVESVVVTGAPVHVNLETQVGRTYDAAAVTRDVRYLWGLGRFDDVRVQMSERGSAADVRFAVRPKQVLKLHEIRIEPHSFGVQLKLAEGSAIDAPQAQQLATETEKQLRMQGYRQARVSYEFVPAARQEVDLRLHIDSGIAVRVHRVEFAGELGMKPQEVRGTLRALRSKPILPGLWKTLPDYSPEAVDFDLARLRSFYLKAGFFDANVTAGDPVIDGRNATVRFEIQAGPRFEVQGVDMARVCPDLQGRRREAERRGVLDFDASLQVNRIRGGAAADASVKVEEGAPYRVRRIDIFGLHRYRDSTARRNLLLDEGAALDSYLLRQSVARIARTNLFADLESRDIVIQRIDAEHIADIKLRLTERRAGLWRLSGPVGPASVGGPLQAVISSRLPGWGRGILELSTYTATASLLAFAQPIIPVLAVKRFVPLFALTRGFLPGDSWRSGFAVLPQLGWQGSIIGTATAQMQGRLLPVLNGTPGLTPPLVVAVEGSVNGAILCEPPQPRMRVLRGAAALAIRFPGLLIGL